MEAHDYSEDFEADEFNEHDARREDSPALEAGAKPDLGGVRGAPDPVPVAHMTAEPVSISRSYDIEMADDGAFATPNLKGQDVELSPSATFGSPNDEFSSSLVDSPDIEAVAAPAAQEGARKDATQRKRNIAVATQRKVSALQSLRLDNARLRDEAERYRRLLAAQVESPSDKAARLARENRALRAQLDRLTSGPTEVRTLRTCNAELKQSLDNVRAEARALQRVNRRQAKTLVHNDKVLQDPDMIVKRAEEEARAARKAAHNASVKLAALETERTRRERELQVLSGRFKRLSMAFSERVRAPSFTAKFAARTGASMDETATFLARVSKAGAVSLIAMKKELADVAAKIDALREQNGAFNRYQEAELQRSGINDTYLNRQLARMEHQFKRLEVENEVLKEAVQKQKVELDALQVKQGSSPSPRLKPKSRTPPANGGRLPGLDDPIIGPILPKPKPQPVPPQPQPARQPQPQPQPVPPPPPQPASTVSSDVLVTPAHVAPPSPQEEPLGTVPASLVTVEPPASDDSAVNVLAADRSVSAASEPSAPDLSDATSDSFEAYEADFSEVSAPSAREERSRGPAE